MTQVLDLYLWPNCVPVQHLHSIAWMFLGVLAVACLYREVHGPGLRAGLAALLFAVADSHALPAGWLANRNAVVSLFFGALAVRLHVRWRRQGTLALRIGSMAALAAALLAGEIGLGAVAYTVAWQVTL